MNPFRFIKRLPFYWHYETHYQERHRLRLPHEILVYAPGIHFRCPDDATAYSIFQYHLFTPWQRRELTDFLDLARGCERLVDGGASAGVMSLMFAASRNEARILSIEPDPRSLATLKQARALNARPGLRWDIEECALSDHEGDTEIILSGYGATIGSKGGAGKAMARLATLSSVCAKHQFEPDIIKLDIESFESEAVASSSDFLKRTKPRIHLELHLGMIRERDRDPLDVLRTLRDLGYSERRLGSSWSSWERHALKALSSDYKIRHYFLAV